MTENPHKEKDERPIKYEKELSFKSKQIATNEHDLGILFVHPERKDKKREGG